MREDRVDGQVVCRNRRWVLVEVLDLVVARTGVGGDLGDGHRLAAVGSLPISRDHLVARRTIIAVATREPPEIGLEAEDLHDLIDARLLIVLKDRLAVARQLDGRRRLVRVIGVDDQ